MLDQSFTAPLFRKLSSTVFVSLREVLGCLECKFARFRLRYSALLCFSCLIVGIQFVSLFLSVLCKIVVGFIELLLEVWFDWLVCVVCLECFAGFACCLLLTHHVFVLLCDE